MNTYKSAVLILTNGRPNSVYTFNSLKRCGYTGEIYLLVDDEDTTADEYIKNFGKSNIIRFNKEEIAKTFDTCDTQQNRQASVYARNASFDIAKQLGLDYFIQLDDDYTSFMFRWAEDKTLKHHEIKNINKVFAAMIEFIENTGSDTLAMAQGGDFIGGAEGGTATKPLLRKAMNSFVFKTNNDLRFRGRMNEDVNTYVTEGTKGRLMFTSTALMLTQRPTQGTAGGMTEAYTETGTYMKSMYTVMLAPSCVTVRPMGLINSRLHHLVRWNNTVPKIINERHRKPYADTTPVP
jgi:hypothetical protein